MTVIACNRTTSSGNTSNGGKVDFPFNALVVISLAPQGKSCFLRISSEGIASHRTGEGSGKGDTFILVGAEANKSDIVGERSENLACVADTAYRERTLTNGFANVQLARVILI